MNTGLLWLDREDVPPHCVRIHDVRQSCQKPAARWIIFPNEEVGALIGYCEDHDPPRILSNMPVLDREEAELWKSVQLVMTE